MSAPVVQNRIRELRIAIEGMTQEKLAKLCGVTRQTIIALEAGKYSPSLELAFVSSRELDGQRVSAHVPEFDGELRYENLAHDAIAQKGANAVVLALPNGKAGEIVAAIDAVRPETIIVDLSADYRFDERWYYGLPELTRARYAGHRQCRALEKLARRRADAVARGRRLHR